jgi:hypothetical protein
VTASLEGLATLAGVRAFLAERIAPVVPSELAGELRAAMKLLDTVQIELNERHPALRAELSDLLSYSDRIATLLEDGPRGEACRTLTGRAGASSLNLHGLEEIWRDARKMSSTLLVELRRYRDDPATPAPAREEAGELSAEFCACLGEHARARLSWQAVFPVPDRTHYAEETDELE